MFLTDDGGHFIRKTTEIGAGCLSSTSFDNRHRLCVYRPAQRTSLMPSPKRMMTLIAFLQAQNCSNLPGSWRHPATVPDFLAPEYYQRIARTLEDGKIQMAFFDDRLALPDIYTGEHSQAIAAGVRAVKLDPCTIIMAMGMVTQRLGLGATYSTTYYEPYHVARVFATMDLMLKGRAAWNIVTSLNSAEAKNFGGGEHMAHAARYDRADEFMEVVIGHWNTWEDDALILDKANNHFADPAKVHRLDHVGRYFQSRGPFSVPRSPQGQPVLIQAGQSGRGQSFAAKWADLVFVIYHGRRPQMPRASWKGFLRLSLVSCPIYLSPATTRTKSMRLHQVWQPQAARQDLNEDDDEGGQPDRTAARSIREDSGDDMAPERLAASRVI
jgi:alkanesulfonate monooxygenase SsuD/methylene tetrahydromethanopterin reductase-like flavin-dependent oxidoreductase (luciferase family)